MRGTGMPFGPAADCSFIRLRTRFRSWREGLVAVGSCSGGRLWKGLRWG